MRTTTIRAAFAAAITIAASAILPSFADRTLNDGLAAYLPFTDGTPSNAVAGSVVAPENVNTPAYDNNGMIGRCLTTSATNFVKLTGSDTGSLTYGDDNKSFTATVWVRHGDQSSDPLIWGNKHWKGINKGVLLSANGTTVKLNAGNGSRRLDSNVTGSGGVNASPYVALTNEGASAWTFYAVRCSNGTFTLFQGKSDGVTTTSWTGTLDGFGMESGYPFYLGTDGDKCTLYSATRPFVGSIDEFALWTRSLSEEDVLRIYHAGRSGMELGDLLIEDANDAPTMSEATADGKTYTFTFGGRRTKNHALCIAYGATDAGAAKHDWDSFETIATIAPATTAYSYTVPDALHAAKSRFRFFLMQTADLPYAKETEWTQSESETGGSWIYTGIAPRRDMVADLRVLVVRQTKSWDWMFGSMAAKPSNFGLARYYEDGGATGGYWHHETHNGSGGGQNHKPAFCATNEWHVVSYSPPESVTIDGVDYATGLDDSGFVETGYQINLFRNQKQGASVYDQSMYGRISSFRLSTPSQTVRSFVPAADSEGNAGMFDEVTGRFYAGEGVALVAGADRDSARIGWTRCTSETYFAASDDVAATATYTGGGADPLDFADPDNWSCKNVSGDTIEDALPTADTDVTIAGVTAFAITNGATLVCNSVKFDSATPSDGADWRGLDMMPVTADSVIDLKGRSLLVAGASSRPWSAITVTDTSADAANPGTLRLEVASGDTFTNSTIALAGNLKLKKEGDGELCASLLGQTYFGGTEVASGTVRPGTAVTSQFGTGAITVRSGATFEAAAIDCSATHVILDGGTIANSEVNGKCYLPGKLELTADSTIRFGADSLDHDMKISSDAVWNLGGRTLTVVMCSSNPDLHWYEGAVVSNGTFAAVSTVRSSWVQLYNIVADDNLTLDLGNTILRLHDDESKTPSKVKNLTMNATNIAVSTTGSMEVYGTFTPKNNWGFSLTMMDGSAMDLSYMAAAYDCAFTSQSYASGSQEASVTFAENATVTIDLSGWSAAALDALANGEDMRVLKWASAPSRSVAFALDAATAENYAVAAFDDGLYLRSLSAPAYAEYDVAAGGWKYFLGDGSAYQGEWTEVTIAMVVRVKSAAEFAAVKAAGVKPAVFVLKDGSAFGAGAGEIDLRDELAEGMRLVAEVGAVYDIGEKTVTLPNSMISGSVPFTVTSSAGGTLVVDCDADVENTQVTLAGNLKLQKKGAKMFKPSKTGQTYTGGTEIAAGEVRLTVSSNGNFGTGEVIVDTDATLEMYGRNVTNEKIVLAGGVLANSGAAGVRLPNSLLLTEDSTLRYGAVQNQHDMTLSAGAVWNLGGKTLSINLDGKDPDFWMDSGGVTISNGTIVISVGSNITYGYFQMRDLDGSDGLNLDLGNSVRRLHSDSSVCDFTGNPSELAAGPSGTPGTLSIYGRYTPKSVYGQKYRLMDGATLDLSLWTGVWNCTNTEGLDLTFADGVKVSIALGDRTKAELQEIIDGDGFIVKWTSEPAEGVEFSLDDATLERGYRIKRVAGGLRLRRSNGLTIIVK